MALHYPGFDRVRELSDVLGIRARVYAFGDGDCREWYRRFADDVIAAADEHRYLPLYRMGDGEFSFALGAAEEMLPLHRLRPRQVAKRAWKWATGRRGEHRSGSPGYGWEVYTPAERRALLGQYGRDLAFIARHGYLALALDESPLYARFLPRLLDWFDAHGVHLHAGNYQHVYAVYALLHGPDRDRLLRGRRIVVVNHADEARREAVTRGLRGSGAADVQWIGIGRSRAMLERIDPASVDRQADLALVGAGVGASRVVAQLGDLRCPVLDVGFALDVLADPELRWNRPFCVADEALELERIRFLSPDQLRRAREHAAGPAARV
ncbi:MAG TPA: hypothetical protein VF142_21815 [Longimicrobium sp.]